MFKRKILMVAAAVLVVTVLSNPSIQSFKEYIGNKRDVTLSRPSNYFIFSIYQCNGSRYIGAFGNFFYIKKEQPRHINQSTNTEVHVDDELSPFGNPPWDTIKKKKFKYDDKKSVDENLNDFIKINKIKVNKAAH
jgi:hypothetical protein